MSQLKKLLFLVMSGQSDRNIPFHSLCSLLVRLGFESRINGGHHIYYHQDVVEIINLQPKGSKAKPYQVKQVREIILQYKLGRDIS
jgi:hypothetical protein